MTRPDLTNPGNPPAGHQLEFSLSQLTTYHASLSEEVQAAAAAGFDGLGLFRPKLIDFDPMEVIEHLHRAGLRVPSLSWVGGFTGANDFRFEEALADGKDAIAQAAAFGAANVVVVGGRRGAHLASHARKLVIEALRRLADDAAAAGVGLALLPMHVSQQHDWTDLCTLEAACEVLDAVDAPHVGLALDLYHFGDEPRLARQLNWLAPRIRLVQISDGQRGQHAQYRREIPGQGSRPLFELLSGLIQAGYRGPVDLQVWSDDVWEQPWQGAVSECAAFVHRCRSSWAGHPPAKTRADRPLVAEACSP